MSTRLSVVSSVISWCQELANPFPGRGFLMHGNLSKFDKMWHGCSGGEISEEIEDRPQILDWRCDSNGI